MRLTGWLVPALFASLLMACQSASVSEDAQTLARLQQDKARLNRVYANAEIAVLEVQYTDAAMKAARATLRELTEKRLQACPNPTSPNTTLRLRYTQCQYDASLADLERLQQWRKLKVQFPVPATLNPPRN